MTAYDAVVYDLDGTLVDLAVDWDAVAADVAAVLRERGIEPPDDLWRMLDAADAGGERDAVEAVIAEHEREGAHHSTRLPCAEDIPEGVPVAVCSLNCEAACRVALERHGLDGRVEAVVGRDTVDTEKPDPTPLLRAVEALGVPAERTVFVGDSERDERTAERAGVPFVYVSEWA